MNYKFDTIEGLKAYDSELMKFICHHLVIKEKDQFSRRILFEKITKFVSNLRDDLSVIVESDYIDRCYRDLYYSYYSSKLYPPYWNCVRISFFEPLDKVDFSEEVLLSLRSKYRGFLVVRPVTRHIGRNVIYPEARKDNGSNMRIMRTDIPSSCIGVKLDAIGFPHSSQDGEMMTCAETTVWGILEYFGNKYAEYSPILGSRIHKALAQVSFQRQLPSTGLSFQQISTALKEAGFGPKVYSSPNELKEILSCYIESGIPVAVCMENSNIRHAIICVGHEKVDVKDIDKAPMKDVAGKHLYIWNLNISKFLFNDDNRNPYEKADFNDPAENYVKDKHNEWKKARISILIVPLNHKIYLEAQIAISWGKLIAVHTLKARDGSVVRTFLASGRTYKEYLMLKAGIPVDKRKIYYGLNLPKFVWVTEISDVSVCKRGKMNGLIIFDATNPAVDRSNTLWAQYDGKYYFFDRSIERMKEIGGLPMELNQFDLNLV